MTAATLTQTMTVSELMEHAADYKLIDKERERQRQKAKRRKGKL